MAKPSDDAFVETMVLTPKTIPDYCEKTGADEAEIMEKYRFAKSQNKELIGFVAGYPWFMDGVVIDEESDGSPGPE